MKKTISRKIINNHVYFYLTYRVRGKLKTTYLGDSDSIKFRSFLMEMTKEGKKYLYEEARISLFKEGLPLIYEEDGYIVREYHNGVLEFLNREGKRVSLKLKNE